jgi:hypothetical protein
MERRRVAGCLHIGHDEARALARALVPNQVRENPPKLNVRAPQKAGSLAWAQIHLRGVRFVPSPAQEGDSKRFAEAKLAGRRLEQPRFAR